jgi:hypothetical protein
LFLAISVASSDYDFAIGFSQISPFSLILEMNERIEYCSVCFQQMTFGGSEKFKLNERLSKCKVEKRC